MKVLICIKEHLTTFEVPFMKKLRNTEIELKKSNGTLEQCVKYV